jgi:hypothetical protein
MSEVTVRLTKLKEEIDDSKNTKARLEGEMDSLFKRLKKEFGVDTIKEAKDKEKELIEDANALEQDIEKGMVKLEGLYS